MLFYADHVQEHRNVLRFVFLLRVFLVRLNDHSPGATLNNDRLGPNLFLQYPLLEVVNDEFARADVFLGLFNAGHFGTCQLLNLGAEVVKLLDESPVAAEVHHIGDSAPQLDDLVQMRRDHFRFARPEFRASLLVLALEGLLHSEFQEMSHLS